MADNPMKAESEDLGSLQLFVIALQALTSVAAFRGGGICRFRCLSGPLMTRPALLSGLLTSERLRYTLSLVNQCAEFMRSGSAAPWLSDQGHTFLMDIVMAIAKTGKVCSMTFN